MVNKITYNVLAIDVDGDGIPDGNLIEKIQNGKVVSRKFVEDKKMKTLAKEIKKTENDNKKEKKTRVVFNEKTLNKKDNNVTKENITTPQEQPIVRVADATTFGQSLKTGAATGIGITAGSMLVNGIASFFE